MTSLVERKTRWLRMPLSVLIAAALIVVALPAAPAQAAWKPPAPKDVPGVPVADKKVAGGRPAWTADAAAVRGPRDVTWPAAGKATVTLDGASARRAAGSMTAAGKLPVKVGRSYPDTGSGSALSRSSAVGSVAVQLHDRAETAKAGVSGLLMSLSAADGRTGPVSVQVDYSSFAHAYGGDYASRLQLVEMPACALSTPDSPDCRTGKPVKTTKESQRQTLTSEMTLSSEPMMLAVTSGPSGDNGDFQATDLSPAGTWKVSDQTGDFSYSYPLRMPPSQGGPQPSLGFGYSAGRIDGRTSTTNNQGSWVGDGWDFWPGFIERKYQSCYEDNPGHKTGDQCWFSDNATLSLNGHAGELIKSGSVWKLKDDDGTKVERLTDVGRGNGDNNGEYWKVTTPDGTRFYFGYHRLPGWASGKPVTDSTWTTPVYGNNPGEPCYNATFANAWCMQAWRWNLDYIIDPHGNTQALYYAKETGAYGRDNTASQRTTYDRGGYLDHIDYGMRLNSEYTQAAPMRVVFSTAERCLSGCWTGTAWTSDPNPSAWPDTPWDQYCKAAPCSSQLSATFWSARRLTKVTTQVRNGTSTYADVESWTLRHEFLDAGNGEGTPMWLRGITRTGHVTTAGGSEASDPEITFDPGTVPMPNRVDGPSVSRSSLNRWRIKVITNESGGQTLVYYSPTSDCSRSSLPAPETNTTRCMPSLFKSGDTTALDWYHKYVVTQVDLDDVVTDQPTQSIFYDYLDAPAWHYTDDEITPAKYRTWGDWRGYGRVQVRTGAPGGQQTAVETRYLRGMDGDKQPSGNRDVWVADTWGGSIEDHEALNGFVRQSITFDGPGGAEVTSTVNDPWKLGPTATRTSGDVTTNAWKTATGATRSRTPLADGGWRTVKSATAFNDDAMPIAVDSFGDEAISGDETCTRNTYVRNESIWMIDKVSQVEVLSGTCAAASTPAVPSTVLSRDRTFYDTYVDDTSFGTAPTKGDIVRTEELDTWNGNTPVYVATASSKYDLNGRIIETSDALNRKTVTAYNTDAGTGLVTSTAVTNPLSHTATSYVEPSRQLPIKMVDANGATTEFTYDGLGRVTAAWRPGRNKANQTPSARFSYLMRASGGPTAVTAEALHPAGNKYRKVVTLYDGFLRQRQTQTQATGGGRLLTDTMHNAMGSVDWTSAAYYDSTGTAPGTDLATPSGQIPSITQNLYDGAGRVTASILKADGTEKWRTTTIYQGDRTATIPPTGGVVTQQIVDAFGQLSKLRQFHTTDLGGAFDETSYTYTLLGQLKTVTDPAANIWSYTHDLRGRVRKTVDPDKGTTDLTYDAAGQIVTQTSPLGTGTTTTAYTYDALGRKTTVRNDSTTGTIRAQWVYDTLTNGKGKLTSSTRYSGGNAYTSKVDAYDAYGRPTSTSTVLPTAETQLCAADALNACTYTTPITYTQGGALWTTTLPAAADLPSEKLGYGYNDVGDPGGLLSAAQLYIYSYTYNKLGQLTQRQFGAYGKRVAATYDYDEPTRRFTGMNVAPEAKAEAANYGFSYDNAGNTTKITEAAAGQVADTQCFTHDYLARLTQAWTPGSGDCTAAASVAGLGGPAPYWHSWTFDVTGNRKSETRHAATGTTFTYTYPQAGSARPHTLTSVTASGGQTWTRNYTYDNAGNTKTRPNATGGTQTLTWDREGHMLSLTDGADTTNIIYDADGNRLIRKDPDGSKTLYLPGGTEVRYDKSSNTTKATRYYTHAGTTIAVRTPAGLSWIISDHHGTAELTINAGDLTVAKRRMLPYGQQRGTTTGTWAEGMDKGFVGGTTDPTGLTHLGAREYDPTIGRFISRDPIIDFKDPQQINGYAYANGNPTTLSDPSGLRPDCGNGGTGRQSCDNSAPAANGGSGWSNNHPTSDYDKAKGRVFSGAAPAGNLRKSFNGPVKPGNGIIVTRLFISEAYANGVFHGDNRDFSIDPNAGFRVSVAWNTDTGEVVIEVAGSSNILWSNKPFSFGEGSNFTLGQTADGGLSISVDAKNPQLPRFMTPAINMTIAIDVTGPRAVVWQNSMPTKMTEPSVRIYGDPFPSVEVVQYRNGHEARFLARSREAGFGGPGFNLTPFAVDRHENFSAGDGMIYNDGPSFCPTWFAC